MSKDSTIIILENYYKSVTQGQIALREVPTCVDR
jgi:hypothetical protein